MTSRVWNLVEKETLVNGEKEISTTVRAFVFGKMVELGRDRIKHFRSDLYHDAKWIAENLNGPMQFDWVARESGTFIGDSALSINEDAWSDAVKYRFEIVLEEDKWILRIYESIPAPVPMGPDQYVTWETRHAALDVRDCDMAASAAGCIWHPAPVNGFPPPHCTGYMNGGGEVMHDEDCSVHEYLVNDVSCTGHFNGNGDLVHDGPMCFVHEEIPTLRNDSTVEPSAPIRKVNNMYDIINDLRSKLEDAESSKEELSEAKYDLDSAIDDLETYIDELSGLIDTLDNLPEVSVSVSVDVSFDS